MAWWSTHGQGTGKHRHMRLLHQLGSEEPLPNRAAYDVVRQGEAWTVEHQVTEARNARFIDQFCADQSVVPSPPTGMTRERP